MVLSALLNRGMRAKKAFTLIELLVVIAIIALLLAIIMPALKRVKEQAKQMICNANGKQIVMALILYSEDYDRIMEMEYGDRYWFRQIAPYLGEDYFKENPEEIMIGSMGGMIVGVCPSTKIVLTDEEATTERGYGTYNETWHFEWGEGGVYAGSYAINSWILEDAYGWYEIDHPRYFGAENFPSLRGDVPVLADSFWVDTWPTGLESMPPTLAQLKVPVGALQHDDNYFMWRVAVDRHKLGVNVSFRDGHSEKVDIVDLWTLRWNNDFVPNFDMVLPAQ